MLSTALWSQWGLSLPQGADLEQKLESFEPQTQFGRLFNLRCPCFICRCRRNREAGKGRSSQLMFNAKCSYEMEHPSANQPLAELSPAPLIHPVTWLIHTEDVWIPTLPSCAHQSCYHFPKDSLFLWGKYMGPNLSLVQFHWSHWGFTPETFVKLFHKGRFSPFHLLLHEFEISSLLVTNLCLNSGVYLF